MKTALSQVASPESIIRIRENLMATILIIDDDRLICD
jgi:hypothetical protein